eukprot:471506-Prymnesium_polylepis.1
MGASTHAPRFRGRPFAPTGSALAPPSRVSAAASPPPLLPPVAIIAVRSIHVCSVPLPAPRP